MRRTGWSRWLGAVIPLFLLGVAAGWQAYGMRTNTDQVRLTTAQIGSTLVQAHQLSTANAASGVDFPPKRFEAYAKLVERRLGVKLDLSALDNTGLKFNGGSLILIQGEPAAQLLFSADDKPASLLILPNIEGFSPERIGAERFETPVWVAKQGQYVISSIGWAPGSSARKRLGKLIVSPDGGDAHPG